MARAELKTETHTVMVPKTEKTVTGVTLQLSPEETAFLYDLVGNRCVGYGMRDESESIYNALYNLFGKTTSSLGKEREMVATISEMVDTNYDQSGVIYYTKDANKTEYFKNLVKAIKGE